MRKVARRGELDVRLDVARETRRRPQRGEYEAKRYEVRIKSGNVLLSVHVDDSEWSNNAERILKDTGADEISSTSEAKGDYANADKPMPRYQK